MLPNLSKPSVRLDSYRIAKARMPTLIAIKLMLSHSRKKPHFLTNSTFHICNCFVYASYRLSQESFPPRPGHILHFTDHSILVRTHKIAFSFTLGTYIGLVLKNSMQIWWNIIYEGCRSPQLRGKRG